VTIQARRRQRQQWLLDGDLLAAAEPDRYPGADTRDADADTSNPGTDSGDRAVTRFDCLIGYHAELDHLTCPESTAGDDVAATDQSGRAAGFPSAYGSRGNRHVDDYHRDACTKAVGTRTAAVSALLSPFARFAL